MRMTNEAKVGLMITVSFTLFILIVGILTKINLSQGGYRLHIYFGFLNDLRVGAPVKLAGGIKIGQVNEIKQSGDRTEVDVWIDRKFKLLKSAKFAIFTTGIIGEKYINVFVPPTADVDEFFFDGDKIFGIDPPSFDRMMLTFQGFMQDKSGGQILAEIFQNSNKFVESLRMMVEENRYDVKRSVLLTKSTIANLSVQTNLFMNHLNILTKNMAQISEKNKEDISVSLKNISEISSHLNKIIYRMESGRGTLGKLLTEEEIYNNLNDASIFARDLFYSLKKDPSKLLFSPKK